MSKLHISEVNKLVKIIKVREVNHINLDSGAPEPGGVFLASSSSVFTVEGVALFSDASSDFCDSCCSIKLLYREGIEADTRLYPHTKRKVRRRGLQIAQQGLAKHKKKRFKIMQKKYGDLLLDEEVKDDQRHQSKSKGNSARTATNERAFKKTGLTKPNKSQHKRASGGTSSKTSLMN
jgi:hypothetical protein